MAKKDSLETAIRNIAENKLNGKYNLSQYKEGGKRHQEKLDALTHKSVCEQVMAFKKTHEDIPLYQILSVGISKGAFKKTEFDKGYKRFDAKKVEAVVEFGRYYNKYHGIKSTKISDVTIRLMTRYYEKVSTDMGKFLLALASSKVMGKECNNRGHYDELCKNLGIPYKFGKDKKTTEEEKAA